MDVISCLGVTPEQPGMGYWQLNWSEVASHLLFVTFMARYLTSNLIGGGSEFNLEPATRGR